ncbi:MAG: cell division topological specificity factor MinE [Oscillospiraceae bacterium]|nr:cell division topological specificity factor MinE [Oscillospiraceae bacterium]
MDFFSFFKSKKTKSKDEAKNRLQLVLVHDRANVSPEFLETLKGEILEVILKYAEIDRDEYDIQLTGVQSEDGQRQIPALVANIPITRMKHCAEAESRG